jgi:hypothetical protein
VTTSATKIRNLLLALTLAGGVVLAGCGDTDDDSDRGTTGVSSSDTEQQVEDGVEETEGGTDEQPDLYNDNDNDGKPPSEGEGNEAGTN